MSRLLISFVVTLYLSLLCRIYAMSPAVICESGSSSVRTVKLSIKSKRNESGDWTDTFSALTDSGSVSSNETDLDVTHMVIECDGKRYLYVQGVSRGASFENERLIFHPRVGKNIAIVDKGRSVQKLNLDDPHNSVAFTKRPLKEGEMFEVVLEKKNTKFSHSLGFGISTKAPSEVEILPQSWLSPYAWVIYNEDVYNNATTLLKKYGRNVNELKVGDRVGVIRDEHGTLRFFVNGVDQGPAASNIPFPVYGVVDLWNNAVKATIVDRNAAKDLDLNK